MATGNELPSDTQVRLRLSTREQDIVLPDAANLLVPTAFRRYQLSTLVNNILGNEKPIPLDFLINGTYLRTSLEDYLTENGISAETVLAIEYVRARIPPQYVASFEHDDWVSDVDVFSGAASTKAHGQQRNTRVLTSSYDGHVRVWNTSGQVLTTSPGLYDGGHASAITSAKFVSSNQIVSASSDRTVRVWKYVDEGADTVAILPQIELCGHKSSVNSVRGHASSKKLLTGSSDHDVGLWSLRKSDAPPAPEHVAPKAVNKDGKRRKLNPSISVPQRGPLALMRSHTGPVSEAIFDENDATVGYSVSQDHTVRTWDLVTAALVDTRTTSNVLYCIQQMPALHLLACGSAGRDIKLIDPRASATTVAAMTLKGHKNLVVTLAHDPASQYGLLSGSHDGTCRIWDVRSSTNSKDGVTGQSLYTIARNSLQGGPAPLTGAGVKVFGVCWDSELGVLSAGEDKVVQVNSGDGVA